MPTLRAIRVSSLEDDDTPVLRIKTDEDVEAWKHTRSYQDYGLFLRRLAESVVGYSLPYDVSEPDEVQLLSYIPCYGTSTHSYAHTCPGCKRGVAYA